MGPDGYRHLLHNLRRQKLRPSPLHHERQSAMIRLEVPGVPPTTNHAYVNAHGKRILSEVGRKYKNETIAHLSRTYPTQLRLFQANHPYALIIDLHLTDIENAGWPKTCKTRYKHADGTNRVKLFEDCLKDVGGYDDSQHMFVGVVKSYATEARTIAWVYDLTVDNINLGEVLSFDQYRR
jgi:hypothetical protein